MPNVHFTLVKNSCASELVMDVSEIHYVALSHGRFAQETKSRILLLVALSPTQGGPQNQWQFDKSTSL